MPEPASTVIAKALIQNIEEGSIAVDAAMPSERRLCEQFSTSRPTVRAALQIMQSMGYVSLKSTRRPRATMPSIGGIFDAAGQSFRQLLGEAQSSAYLDQIRRYIEVGAVRSAAQNATNVHMTKIHAALEQCSKAVGERVAFGKADAAFHRSLVEVTGNPIILELHDRFVYELVSGREFDEGNSDGDLKSYNEHCQIYESIVDGNAEQAMSIMDHHLSRSFRSRLPRPEKLARQSGKSKQ